MAKFLEESEIDHTGQDIGSVALGPTDCFPAVTFFVIRRGLRRKAGKSPISGHKQMHVPCALRKAEQHHAMALPFQGAATSKVQVVEARRDSDGGMGIDGGEPFVKLIHVGGDRKSVV